MWRSLKPWLTAGRFVVGVLTFTVLLGGVACGAAAPATAMPTKGPSQVPTVVATPAPVPAGAASSVVSPGKVTWLTPGWGNGRYDPAFYTGDSNTYLRLVHAQPIATNEKSELLPGIATAWQISGDGLTWTVTIRKGVKFHDGTELTAVDALWTWQHTMSPVAAAYTTSSNNQALGRLWDKAELTGIDKVSVSFKTSTPSFITHKLFEGSAETNGILPRRATLHDENLEAAFDKNPIGTGPMKLVKQVSEDSRTFERFEDFYHQPKYGLPEDRRVKFTALELRLVPEEATRAAALRSGQADIAIVSLGSKGQIEAGGGRLVFGREGSYIDVSLQGCWHAPVPCRDKRVRQALDYALNRQVLMEKLYGGPTVAQAKGWAVVTPGSMGYSPDLDPRPFDPARARQLLADAGYPDGRGFGKLVVNTYVSALAPLLPEAAQFAADGWRKELGIDVEVKLGDNGALKKASLSQELDGQIFWRDNEARLDGSGALVQSYADPKQSNRLHDDPELFPLAQKAFSISDPVERTKAYANLYPRLREEAYQLSVGYINIPWGVGPRIVTWQPYPFSSYPTALYTVTLK